MKGFKILALLLFMVATSCGQQKKYVSYTIKKGETMKEIAKRLNMKTRDLLRLNPDVDRRPEENTLIIIPNTKQVKKKEENKKNKIDEVKSNTIVIDEKDIKPLEVKVDIDKLKKDYVVHKIKNGDSFYQLARFFNVAENDLQELNPQLTDEELEEDSYVLIKPKTDETEVSIYADVIKENSSINIAMLLPFKAASYDTISGDDIFARPKNLANIVTDFYLGSQIAIDSIRKLGVQVDVKVYDTGARNSKIREIIKEESLDTNDVLIGPFYSSEVKTLAKEVKVPLVYPVYSSNQSDFTSRHIIKAIPSIERRKEVIVSYIKNMYQDENLIVITDSIQRVSGALDKTLRELKTNRLVKAIKIIEPKDGYIKKEVLVNSLVSGAKNLILLETEKQVMYYDAVNSLISLPTQEDIDLEKEEGIESTMIPIAEDTEIQIFCYMKTDEFDIIDNNKLAKLNFTYASDIFENEQSREATVFNKKYLEKNDAMPSYYATKGFDITFDTLMRLASGNELKYTFEEGSSFRTETMFNYSNQIFKTFDNHGLFILKYNPDLTITRLK